MEIGKVYSDKLNTIKVKVLETYRYDTTAFKGEIVECSNGQHTVGYIGNYWLVSAFNIK